MNNARLMERMGSLTNVARKVLAATPVEDSWSLQQIASEVYRMTGSRMDVRVIQGCLKQLIDYDFVRLISSNHTYQQCVKLKEEKVVPIMATPPLPVPPLKTVPTPTPTPTPTPFERMAKIADVMRGLADELDSVALEVSEKLSAPNAELAKLRQLQDLLRGLT